MGQPRSHAVRLWLCVYLLVASEVSAYKISGLKGMSLNSTSNAELPGASFTRNRQASTGTAAEEPVNKESNPQESTRTAAEEPANKGSSRQESTGTAIEEPANKGSSMKLGEIRRQVEDSKEDQRQVDDAAKTSAIDSFTSFKAGEKPSGELEVHNEVHSSFSAKRDGTSSSYVLRRGYFHPNTSVVVPGNKVQNCNPYGWRDTHHNPSASNVAGMNGKEFWDDPSCCDATQWCLPERITPGSNDADHPCVSKKAERGNKNRMGSEIKNTMEDIMETRGMGKWKTTWVGDCSRGPLKGPPWMRTDRFGVTKEVAFPDVEDQKPIVYWCCRPPFPEES